MGFQRVVQNQPAPAVEGDFASNNPMASLVPPLQGAYVVGDANVRIGYFAWGSNTGKVYSTLAAATADGGPVIGFVARQPNIPAAMITAFLGEAIMTLQLGREVTLMSGGDFYAALPGATPSLAANVFALATTGAPSLVDDATTEPTGFRSMSTVPVNAVTAATSTIAVTTGILTIVTLNSGVVEVGQRVTGTGVPDGTYITRQLTGAVGAAGTYATNSINRAAVAAFAATLVQGNLAKIGKAAP